MISRKRFQKLLIQVANKSKAAVIACVATIPSDPELVENPEYPSHVPTQMMGCVMQRVVDEMPEGAMRELQGQLSDVVAAWQLKWGLAMNPDRSEDCGPDKE